MNEKIGLPDLTRAIADKSNIDIKVCDSFLRELFSMIAQTLVSGENVKIKGIGTFKSIEVEQRKSVNVNTGQEMLIPGHRKVSFTPDKALAEAVNAPFAMFDAVELADDITEQILANVEVEEELPSEPQSIPPPLPEVETEPETEFNFEPEHELTYGPEPEADTSVDVRPVQEADLESVVEPLAQHNSKKEQEIEPDKVSNEDEASAPIPPSQDFRPTYTGEPYIYETEEDESRKSHFGKGFIIGLVSAIVAVVVIIVVWRFAAPASLVSLSEKFTGVSQSQTAEQVTGPVEVKAQAHPSSDKPHTVPDTAPKISPVSDGEAAYVPTPTSDADVAGVSVKTNPDEVKPSDTPKTEPKAYPDKITKKRYLTTMAREYYGNYHLWPFIYDYNKGLGHPDRIRPGTRIMVPTPKTLGIDPTDPAIIKKAKNRGIEIYNRYR